MRSISLILSAAVFVVVVSAQSNLLPPEEAALESMVLPNEYHLQNPDIGTNLPQEEGNAIVRFWRNKIAPRLKSFYQRFVGDDSPDSEKALAATQAIEDLERGFESSLQRPDTIPPFQSNPLEGFNPTDPSAPWNEDPDARHSFAEGFADSVAQIHAKSPRQYGKMRRRIIRHIEHPKEKCCCCCQIQDPCDDSDSDSDDEHYGAEMQPPVYDGAPDFPTEDPLDEFPADFDDSEIDNIDEEDFENFLSDYSDAHPEMEQEIDDEVQHYVEDHPEIIDEIEHDADFMNEYGKHPEWDEDMMDYGTTHKSSPYGGSKGDSDCDSEDERVNVEIDDYSDEEAVDRPMYGEYDEEVIYEDDETMYEEESSEAFDDAFLDLADTEDGLADDSGATSADSSASSPPAFDLWESAWTPYIALIMILIQ